MKRFYREIVDHAIDQAKQSSHDTFTHGAVLLHRSKILATGFNNYILHAERDVFSNLKKTMAKRCGYTVFVVRVNRSGELRNSKPCQSCMSYLKFQNVHNVYYSTDSGIEKMVLQ